MKTTFIYTLNDPVSEEVRYLGKSDNPKIRYAWHLAHFEGRTHRDRWVKSLKNRGLRPVLEIIDEVPVSQWKFWEREYIRVYRMIGIRLVNGTEGGDGFQSGPENPRFGATNSSYGMLGKKHTSERNRKMSEIMTGKLPWNTGLKIGSPTSEARANMSLGRLGIKFSEEHKSNLSAARKGKEPWNKGLKGSQVAWNKGLTKSEYGQRA